MNEMNRYQSAFDELPDKYNIDLNKIRSSKKTKTITFSGVMTAVLIMLAASFTTVYAVNENFRTDFTMWITGKRTTAEVVQIDDTHYEITITMPDGNALHTTAESVEPMDTQTVIEHYRNIVEVMENDKGKVMFYYQDKIRDITKLFKPVGVSVQETAEDGTLRSITIADYCYYPFEGRYHCIIHLTNEKDGINRYTVMSSLDKNDIVQGGYGGYMLPTYEMYSGNTKYYETAELRDVGEDTYLFYHDEQICINDRWIDWNVSADYEETDVITGETFTVHFVYDAYCYLKVNDIYFSLRKEHSWQDDDPDNICTGWAILDSKEGYTPIKISEGMIAPVPEGEPIAKSHE